MWEVMSSLPRGHREVTELFKVTQLVTAEQDSNLGLVAPNPVLWHVGYMTSYLY